MLNAAAKALISFELEVNSMFNRNPWPTKKLFPLSPPMTFPNLRSLNLTFVEFGDDGKDLAQAIDFTALTSLTLRKCRGWSRVLVEAFTSRNKAMELKWLEIQHDQPSEIDIHRLSHLLTNCPYLVNVSICHGQDSTNVSHTLLAQLWVALCTQKRFLKAMVVHLFDFFSETDIPSPSGDPRSPIPNDGLAALMTTSMWISVTNTSPLAYVNVEFLGLCSFPDETLV
ncbi:hypothetical protein BGW36DRAFT_367099 [Talaromyces proteolyticus]|uniref:Uncharacterized protein n=1 Tax=Talaromyces proteolyticus TaxID=1131652 RepID=A0AAD4L5Z6_9EURO|nr:uncharacterized protein BGW36DRAFT_367099 [Talaromyces proteolyticus]KAH8705215.1 hypothetical protein BGW36DRAFT_367099 [Talaromyces proteolyticus]